MARSFKTEIRAFLGLNEGEGTTVLKKGESPRMVNLKVTPNLTLKLREGYKRVCRGEGEGRGITYFKNAVIFVTGKKVFRYDGECSEVGELESEKGRVSFLPLGGSLYLLDGVKIKVYDGALLRDIEPYIPLVAISCNTAGAGVPFEKVNLISDKRRQSYTITEGLSYFTVTERDVDSIDEVRQGGEVMEKTAYTVDLESGEVKLKGEIDYSPNAYEVTYTKHSDGMSDRIHKMRYAVAWGGDNDTRVFLWGDEEYPSTYRYSEVYDGTTGFDYFPELNVISVPSGSRVTSLLNHYDRLLVFTEGETYYSYIEAKTDPNGIGYFSYPFRTLSSTVGSSCSGTAVLVDNTPLTVFEGSLYRWVSTSVRDERNAEEIGERIRRGLKELGDFTVFDRASSGEVYFLTKKGIYVYNYRLDVFYYYEGLPAVAFAESDNGEVYFVSSSGDVAILTDDALDENERIAFLWESGYRDTLGLESKNIYSLDFELIPVTATFFDVYWVSDSASGKLSELGLDYRVLNFSDINFKRLSFKTAKAPVRLSKRLKLKRAEGVKLIIENNSDGRDFHLTALSVRGRITDTK